MLVGGAHGVAIGPIERDQRSGESAGLEQLSLEGERGAPAHADPTQGKALAELGREASAELGAGSSRPHGADGDFADFLDPSWYGQNTSEPLIELDKAHGAAVRLIDRAGLPSVS